MAEPRPTEVDADLVGRALEGSEDACRRLVERHQRGVFSLIVRMVGDAGLAEDLAQDAFLKAFQALGSFDRRRKFSSWLLKIAHNTTIDHLRRRRLETVPLEGEGESGGVVDVVPSADRDGPSDRFEVGELGEGLEAAIRGLRQDYRTAILLRYSEGLSYEEISEVMELPLGTVKTHLHRARKALMADLERAGWTPGSRRR